MGPEFLRKRDSPSCCLSFNYIQRKLERFLFRQRSQSLTIAVSNHNSNTCLPNIFKYYLIKINLINTSWWRVPLNLRRWGSHRPHGWGRIYPLETLNLRRWGSHRSHGWGRIYPLEINQCLWCYGDNLWKWIVLLACSDMVSAIPNSPRDLRHFSNLLSYLWTKRNKAHKVEKDRTWFDANFRIEFQMPESVAQSQRACMTVSEDCL